MIAAAPTKASETPGMPRRVFDYEVVDFIGEGAGSVIYVVAHPDTKQLYALKHVLIRNEKEERFLQQIQTELEVCQRFSHPALRRCFELKDNKGFLKKTTEAALVMELFDGQPLDRRSRSNVELDIACFIKVAQGLAALHAMGFVHCDLKPSNILMDNAGNVKIIDFGQAARIGSVKERIQGTPDYIAPEQVRREPVTARTDVFNFGATMYYVLSGRTIPTLFTIKKGENSFLVDQAIQSPHDINAKVPETLSNIVMECVRTNPTKRPSEMNELVRRLEIIQHSVRRRGVAVA